MVITVYCAKFRSDLEVNMVGSARIYCGTIMLFTWSRATRMTSICFAALMAYLCYIFMMFLFSKRKKQNLCRIIFSSLGVQLRVMLLRS